MSGWGGSGAESGDARHTPDGGDADEAAAADGGGPEVAGARGELLGTDTHSLTSTGNTRLSQTPDYSGLSNSHLSFKY